MKEDSVVCKICGNDSGRIFEKKVLRSIDVSYYQCSNCGCVQTEKPYWLDKAYSSAITALDIGLLQRNIRLRPIVARIIRDYFDPKAKFLDYGGGYGVFVRLMRDIGFDYYRYDTHCDNLFAEYFDIADCKTPSFNLVTAFEVFEHLEDPQINLQEMLAYTRSVLFTTHLIPEKGISDWWYLTPETGQHIIFYSKKSLETLATKHNLNFYTNGTDVHLLTDKTLSDNLFKPGFKERLLARFNRESESLLMSDYENIRKKIAE